MRPQPRNRFVSYVKSMRRICSVNGMPRNLPVAPSAARTAVSDTRWWYYMDRQSLIQGPFPWFRMKQWFDLGHLNQDLLISQFSCGPFKSLSAHFPVPSQAFASCDTAPGQTFPDPSQHTVALSSPLSRNDEPSNRSESVGLENEMLHLELLQYGDGVVEGVGSVRSKLLIGSAQPKMVSAKLHCLFAFEYIGLLNLTRSYT